jgi:hypothetical protein
MSDREQTINYLTQVKRDLTAKRDRLLRPVQELEKELEHITATLAVVLRDTKTVPEETTDFPIAKLRGLTHRQSVVAIARHNGGRITAQEAKKILLRAGIMSNTKNTTNMVHNAIIQSEKFERIGRGEFRLREPKPKTSDDDQSFRQPIQ